MSLNRKFSVVGAALGLLAIAPSASALNLEISTPDNPSISVVDEGLNDESVGFGFVGYADIYIASGGSFSDSNFDSIQIGGDITTPGVTDLFVAADPTPTGTGTIKARVEDSVTLSGSTKFSTGLGVTPGSGLSYTISAWLEPVLGADIPIFTNLSASGNFDFTALGLAAGTYTLVLEGQVVVSADKTAFINFQVTRTSVPDGGGTLALLGLGSLALASFRRK